MAFYVGQSSSFSKTIAESDIYGFAGISGDFNPVHVNECVAQDSVFGKRIAHGMLGGAMISAVLGMYLPGPGTIYLAQSLTFTKPVYIGDTVTARATIIEIMGKGKARLSTEVINQDGICVISGEALVKLPQKKWPYSTEKCETER